MQFGVHTNRKDIDKLEAVSDVNKRTRGTRPRPMTHGQGQGPEKKTFQGQGLNRCSQFPNNHKAKTCLLNIHNLSQSSICQFVDKLFFSHSNSSLSSFSPMIVLVVTQRRPLAVFGMLQLAPRFCPPSLSQINIQTHTLYTFKANLKNRAFSSASISGPHSESDSDNLLGSCSLLVAYTKLVTPSDSLYVMFEECLN